FWAAAYLGATVVPIVHFYGPKEVSYILRTMHPEVVVTPDRFGHAEHLEWYPVLLGESGGSPLWLVVGDTPPEGLPAGATPFDRLLDHGPVDGPADVDPDAPAIVAFTSGTTR